MHTTPVLKSLHWLPGKEKITFKILLVTYKIFHAFAPTYLNELPFNYTPHRLLRSNSTSWNLPSIPKTKTGYLWRQILLSNCTKVLEWLAHYQSRALLSTFGNVLIRYQNKPLPNHGAYLESCDARLVFMKLCIDGQESREVKRSIRDEKKSDMKKSNEPFYYSLGWTICRKRETRCVHGLNSDRAGRFSELLMICTVHAELFHPGLGSQEKYPGSVKESEICEDSSLIMFFTDQYKQFRISVAAKPIYSGLSVTRTKISCTYSDPRSSEKAKENKNLY